ncbi:MAG TPA: ABC transporter substrate-binding protein [Arenicellales bacterium]|jgi:branched-chain amino acid transport system substrate-binding protein|nr:ABC transporter substrate-binding protein [Nitrospinota bacterium]MDP6733853.1 ABC transporter substrate-binding protein [Gammaproteobacteria bacterium]MDP7452350.1 ABC transporter substrate-binding protein [Arenicellales bacterium]MDP7516859.1 ABC transporter substrate-binding protein [Arenicellales bacterium]HJL51771.1 ABC transporter substrate-binding protein [Arenicellales bacterium]|tara:strand:- start:15052 stop:16347 length:1296 start_codon:yes stop_codon:yes gene_type:complete
MTKTPTTVFQHRFGRRRFLGATAVGIGAAVTGTIPQIAYGGSKTIKLGMNIPLTGDYAPWGLPGLYGCEIVAQRLNASGGVEIGGQNYMIEMAAYDHGYDTEKAVQGFKKLVFEDDVKMVMMLGGSTVASVLPLSNRKKMLTTTLLPSDITPDSNYLVATCESHPLYNVTGVEWLAANFPNAKTAAIVTNNDAEYGLQSAATYKAAFEVEGIDVIDVNLHGFDVTDFAPIVSSVLAKKPDIFCMATSFYVTPLMEQLYHQGFKGKIISCTLDYYDEIIAKTSKEFVDGTIYQFPDFDDPKLTEDGINFPDPGGFDTSFRKDHPNDWSAVAWEYPAILLDWVDAAKAAGSIEPSDVVSTMLSNKNPHFVFGEGRWWGSQLWGLDNAVVGRWPVVTIVDGKARIQEYRSVSAWLDKNKDVLIKHMKALGLRTV